jgi:hypothetical protein
MALLMTASKVHTPRVSPRGDVVDLGELCSRLEDRLLSDEHEISEMRLRGEDTSARESAWIRMLRRYERVCDLLATHAPVEQASAA